MEKARAEYDKLTEKKEYKIIDGASQEVKAGKEATFRSDADFSKFDAVLVDGAIIDANKYTVKEGSTVVTLKEDYTKTLSAGTHSLEIRSNDGSAKTTFTVTTDANKPVTGDHNDLLVWIVIMLGAVLAIELALILKKKARNNK